MAKAVWLKQGSEKYYPAPYWPIGSIYISVVNTNPSHMFSRAPIYYHENKPGQTVAGSLANTFAKPVTYTESTGGSKSHNNLQPFITCYVWIRTA